MDVAASSAAIAGLQRRIEAAFSESLRLVRDCDDPRVLDSALAASESLLRSLRSKCSSSSSSSSPVPRPRSLSHSYALDEPSLRPASSSPSSSGGAAPVFVRGQSRGKVATRLPRLERSPNLDHLQASAASAVPVEELAVTHTTVQALLGPPSTAMPMATTSSGGGASAFFSVRSPRSSPRAAERHAVQVPLPLPLPPSMVAAAMGDGGEAEAKSPVGSGSAPGSSPKTVKGHRKRNSVTGLDAQPGGPAAAPDDILAAFGGTPAVVIKQNRATAAEVAQAERQPSPPGSVDLSGGAGPSQEARAPPRQCREAPAGAEDAPVCVPKRRAMTARPRPDDASLVQVLCGLREMQAQRRLQQQLLGCASSDMGVGTALTAVSSQQQQPSPDVAQFLQ
eukprot:m51a1_g252 hypothetical protein (394) ;mRNA; r:197187-198424